MEDIQQNPETVPEATETTETAEETTIATETEPVAPVEEAVSEADNALSVPEEPVAPPEDPEPAPEPIDTPSRAVEDEPAPEPEEPVAPPEDDPVAEDGSQFLPPQDMLDAAGIGTHPYNVAADEFQSWEDRGETPDGSRCDMAALRPAIAWLRNKAKA